MLVSGIALVWGSSFVFIEVALESFEPAVIAFLRVSFGVTTIAWLPRARTPVDLSDMGGIVVVGALWMAVPFLLFPVAQQWIDSSLAGMVNGSVPLFATLVATLVARRLPGLVQAVGLVIGFAGVVAIGWPATRDARSSVTGLVLVLLATISYGIALNVVVPLQRKYGSLPVLSRVQLVALVLTVGPALASLGDSTFTWPSLLATVPLGCLGTGVAYVWMTTLASRVGPARASVTIYFVPVVAIVLGVVSRDETVALISLSGTALVLLGAYLTSRAEPSRG